jgi:hypothetical protein
MFFACAGFSLSGFYGSSSFSRVRVSCPGLIQGLHVLLVKDSEFGRQLRGPPRAGESVTPDHTAGHDPTGANRFQTSKVAGLVRDATFRVARIKQ